MMRQIGGSGMIRQTSVLTETTGVRLAFSDGLMAFAVGEEIVVSYPDNHRDHGQDNGRYNVQRIETVMNGIGCLRKVYVRKID